MIRKIWPLLFLGTVFVMLAQSVYSTQGEDVPIKRQAGSIDVEVDVKTEQADVSDWTVAKKTLKPEDQYPKWKLIISTRIHLKILVRKISCLVFRGCSDEFLHISRTPEHKNPP